ncbi:MAG TPA: sugar phosphate isomerase/epimerase [Terriglobia bacterium]|nr:sugar phosphate isomerase/epimerase [Terriglobia bacterium]
MFKSLIQRRQFLSHSSVTAAGLLGALRLAALEGGSPKELHLSSNEYSWTVFYKRENRDFKGTLESALPDLTRSSLNGLEPSIEKTEEIDRLGPLLKKNNLEMRSIYVNSSLHQPDRSDKSIGQILTIARKAKEWGTRIIVTNPSPIRWGGPENKDDTQLGVQASALNRLGEQLGSLGLKLAYHNHDIELRNAAREFHHMMLGTDPAVVSLCLDAHWVYRGAGNSQVALFDVVKLYGARIIEIHLRQSKGNVWSETFAEGDINYAELAKQLLRIGVKPHLVLEVAVEEGTPKTMDPVEAHRRSSEYARKVFAGFA